MNDLLEELVGMSQLPVWASPHGLPFALVFAMVLHSFCRRAGRASIAGDEASRKCSPAAGAAAAVTRLSVSYLDFAFLATTANSRESSTRPR